MSKILQRIIRETGTPEILNILTELTPSDLQSLLLELYARRSDNSLPKAMLDQYCKSRFTTPCKIPQRDLIAFDTTAYSLLPQKYESIELSPVAPFAMNSSLANTSQKNVMSAVRNVEVLADPTSTLLVECASRRRRMVRKNPRCAGAVRLATSHRLIRTQRFDDIEGFTSHFRAFSIAIAGRDIGGENFEKEALLEQILFYLSLLTRLHSNGNFHFSGIRVALSDIRVMEALIIAYSMDRQEISRNTQNAALNVFQKYAVDLPEKVGSATEVCTDLVDKYHLQRIIERLKRVEMYVFAIAKRQYPHIVFEIDLARTAGIGYYSDLCFKITAKSADNTTFPLVDGGMTDWTQKLVQSQKERSLASGIGTELICTKFR